MILNTLENAGPVQKDLHFLCRRRIEPGLLAWYNNLRKEVTGMEDEMGFRDKKETMLERDRMKNIIKLIESDRTDEALELLKQYVATLTEVIETSD